MIIVREITADAIVDMVRGWPADVGLDLTALYTTAINNPRIAYNAAVGLGMTWLAKRPLNGSPNNRCFIELLEQPWAAESNRWFVRVGATTHAEASHPLAAVSKAILSV